ncbi:MAG: hypothetical protein EAZ92_12295 [Candidatus Kapaibacterium sp.]|nr:MAG: hypothetical protein EAZ92_12295 [Candidatus Kapabacteria bacterium]
MMKKETIHPKRILFQHLMCWWFVLMWSIAPTPCGAQNQASQASTPQNTTSPTALRVWLTVEVLERKPSLDNTANALNEYIPVVILDSASNGYLYALSGEMVELAPERTYWVSVVSGEDKRFQVRGAPVQVVRTGLPTKLDLVYQREFIINDILPADTELALPERISSDAQPAKPSLKPEAATISYHAKTLSECPYIVQFCALSLEADATIIRNALKGSSIQDARVEPFRDVQRNIQYFRVRAGCFAELAGAKAAQDSYFKTAQKLKLGVVPIVVKQ